MVSSTVGLEAWFISSLAGAGHCHKHTPKPIRPVTFFTSHRPNVSTKDLSSTKPIPRRRNFTGNTQSEAEERRTTNEANQTREELMELVDQYHGTSYTHQLPIVESPNLYQPGNGPHLQVSDEEEDEWPPPLQAWPADGETKEKLKKLESALKHFYTEDAEDVYQIYRELPEPRAPYLEANLRHMLLRHLSIVERKDEHSMLRYFSVVDDMKSTAIPLTISEWTSAISFASKYVAKATEVEVESALKMWKEMEHIAGVRGNNATFNVLYDVACKAGKFTLGEMIYKEMIARGLEYNRFHYVSMIFTCGLKKDGDGARAAYKALVDAGEIVDTVVLNAMISALIKSYEPSAALNIYERMKTMHAERTGTQEWHRSFKNRREVKRGLLRMAMEFRHDPEGRAKVQERSIVCPDLQTYRLLVNHFAITEGELDKAAKFLEEMGLFNVPLHGALFLSLFKGFHLHGGTRYTKWTAARLESVWKAYLKALDKGVEDIYMSTWIVTNVLKAFATCSGQARATEVWRDIRERWQPDERQLNAIMPDLYRIGIPENG
ncbi:hypothetical protein SS1G_03931 [Sclerotinia sclerotiorum 1980 UF-70]|uniref:Pentacotripeptide-repeat region of PRORP domain-containing protein n=2 Tax=Sclerotinia sclerotiorum (strain ATCC 18683 / 1980 / Ss-1) TaxID=665079 RepID=A7EF40_SCLS1|nr:hypothetical protein SS1G_03931 [Sclerotinia sclerotiorum 1980 UF-70]APA12465.1 hypothetical protein sscle_09g072350 [Sclerotinia sclerotiorum 1980 UF-70]EDO01456.1 hypothetical protein SS1G_03931 [Sclerotinia sclerotiorum 1980 UF-70]